MATGRLRLQSGRFPPIDSFSFTRAGGALFLHYQGLVRAVANVRALYRVGCRCVICTQASVMRSAYGLLPAPARSVTRAAAYVGRAAA